MQDRDSERPEIHELVARLQQIEARPRDAKDEERLQDLRAAIHRHIVAFHDASEMGW